MNKKLVLSVLSTALVASMASAAMAKPSAGIYIGGDVDKYYSAIPFLDNFDAALDEILDNLEDSVFVDPNGNAAKLTDALSADDINSVLKPAVEADFEANDYAVVGEEGKVWNPKDETDWTPGELKVESVSAINANEIKIEFSTQLDETDAADEALFTINGKALAGADKVTLQDDGKSVVIEFDTTGAGVLENAGAASKVDVAVDGYLNNNTAYTVGVAATLKDAEGNELDEVVSKPLFFSDSVKPTVTEVKTLENGNVRVKISERFALNSGAVIINGQSVSLTIPSAVVLSDDTYNGYLEIPKANIDAATTLVAGTSYPIVISGVEDFAGNAMNLYSGTFTYGTTADAPTVTAVTAKDEKTLVVTFSEPVQAPTATTIDVFKGVTDLNVTTFTNPSGDNKTFEVALPTAADTLFDSTKNETSVALTVKLNGYKDTAGNIGQAVERTVTVTKDTTKPSVTKAEYTFTAGAPADNKVTLTVSEETAVAAAAALQGSTPGANLYITDNNGVRYDVATVDITDALAGTTDRTFTIDLDGVGITANGTYTLHIAAGTFTDASLNGGNDNAAQTISFNVTGVATDNGKPTVTVAPVGGSNGVMTATYNEPVKGGNVAGSATDVANYKLNGAALPAETVITLNAARTVATITLPAGSLTTSGTQVVTVSNVQDLAGNVIETANQTVTLTENKSPELVSAKVLNTSELELTFSEAVDTAVNLDFSDFEVQINGVDVTEAAGTTAASGNTKFVISVSDASLATGTITVEVLDTANATDAATNPIVEGTKVTATR